MNRKKLSILQVTAGVSAGGAARIALYLFEGLQKQGFHSLLGTGGNIPPDKNYLKIPINTYDHSILFQKSQNLLHFQYNLLLLYF